MEEGGRQEPPGLAGGQCRQEGELGVEGGDGHLHQIDHHAGGDEPLGDQSTGHRSSAEHGAHVPTGRRCSASAVHAVHADGARHLALGAGGTIAALAAHVCDPVGVPWAYWEFVGRIGGELGHGWVLSSGEGIEYGDAAGPRRAGGVEGSSAAHFVTVTEVMTTSSRGRSRGSVDTAEIASTT